MDKIIWTFGKGEFRVKNEMYLNLANGIYSLSAGGCLAPRAFSSLGVSPRPYLRRSVRSNVSVGHKALRWDEHLAQS